MSDNKNPSVAQVAEHFYGLTEEEQTKIGDIETPEGYSKALESFFASLGDADADEGTKERKKKEARMYTVLLMIQTGEGQAKVDLIGHGLGSIGREAVEPTKWSPARQLQGTAEVRSFGLKKKGMTSHVLVLPSEEYLAGSFMAPPKVEAPKVEPVTQEQEQTAAE